MRDMRRCWFFFAVFGLAGCSGEDSDEGGLDKPTSVVIYGPMAETELTPYPSNRYSVEDGTTATGLRVNIDPSNTTDAILGGYPTTLTQLNEMDGFSTTGGLVVKLSSPIDPRGVATFPDGNPPIEDPVRDAAEFTSADSPLILVDVDPESPDYKQPIGLIPFYYEQAKDDFFIIDEFTLVVHPAVPLRPATRYAFVVTDALKAHDGSPVGRSPDMTRALGSSTDPYEMSLRDGIADLISAVPIDQEKIVGGSVFTTASVQDGIIEMAKARRAAPVPTALEPWTVQQEEAPRVRFRTTYPAPEFRKAKPDGKWELEPSGAPKVQKTENLEVFLAFSDQSVSGPRPVVIYGHGLGGDKDGNWGTAERLGAIHANGAAVFAIDSPEHGSRGSGETGLVGSVFGFFGIDPDTQEFDIGRARDNFRQMASDQLELVRFINSLGTLDLLPVGAPDGVPDLDVSRILYIGHSFGSVQGATVFAIAPEIKQANWNVGGAGLMMLLRDSNTFSLVVDSLTPTGTPFGSVARFMAATQAIVDPGDPLNYARNCTLEALPGVENWSARDVLLQEVTNDNIVPNSTSEALARAAGMQIMNGITDTSGLASVDAPATSNLAGGATGVLCQFDKAAGKTVDHGSLIFADEAIQQYVEFFVSGMQNPHATVVKPY
jgi:hypothetical protein